MRHFQKIEYEKMLDRQGILEAEMIEKKETIKLARRKLKLASDELTFTKSILKQVNQRIEQMKYL